MRDLQRKSFQTIRLLVATHVPLSLLSLLSLLSQTIRLLVATQVLPLLPTLCWLSAAKCDSGGADGWGREWLPRNRLATTHTCNTCFCPPTSCPQLVLFVLLLCKCTGAHASTKARRINKGITMRKKIQGAMQRCVPQCLPVSAARASHQHTICAGMSCAGTSVGSRGSRGSRVGTRGTRVGCM